MEKEFNDLSEIQSNVETLITRILPQSVSQSQILEKFLPYSMRFLSANFNSKIIPGEHIREKIQEKLNPNIKNQQMFLNLATRLAQTRFLKNRTSIYNLLYNLSNDSKVESFDSIFTQNLKQIAPNATQTSYTDQSTDTSMFNQSTDTCRQINEKGNKKINLSENDLITDLLFVFQGIESKYTTYNKKEDFYYLLNNIPVSEPVRNQVNKLCEVGWVFRKITSYLQCMPTGLINQSFHEAIQEEINEYYKLIAIFQQKLQENSEENIALNLRKLVLWTQEPFERLKWLSILIENVRNFVGCKLISSVYSYNSTGNPELQQLIQRIMSKINQPLLILINEWIFLGELRDLNEEFFVQCDNSIEDIELWQKKYTFYQQQIPSIIDKEQAEKIFTTGKSINFLKKCCGVSNWKLNLEYQLAINNDFKQWINEAYKQTNQKLMEVMIGNFQLKSHIYCIQSFLLMGQGGFIQMLMDLIGNELGLIFNQIYKHNLVGLLETAIRSTNAQFYSQEFIQRLDVKLLEGGSGDKGWDIFSLDYTVENPISTIFTEKSMKCYIKIFNFLWRIKRVEFQLSNIWKSHMKFTRIFKDFKDLELNFLRCNSIRNEMKHFISNLLNYIMLEVIDFSYLNLIEQLEKAKDMNHLIEIHDDFVQQIMDKGLLTAKSDKIYNQLLKIFDLILKFTQSQEMLMLSMHEISNQIKENQNQKKIQEILGEGVEDMEDFNSERLFNIKNYIITIRKIHEQYRKAMQEFMNILLKNEKFKFLSFRLDFNEFYTNTKDLVQEKQTYFKVPDKTLFSNVSKYSEFSQGNDNFKFFGGSSGQIFGGNNPQISKEKNKDRNFNEVLKNLMGKQFNEKDF